MFEKERPSYPCAVTGSSATDPTATRRAAAWALEHLRSGQQLMVVFPGRQNADYEPVLCALARQPGVVSATWRTLLRERWSGGPVLAAWPNAQELAELAERPRITALCVIPWQEEHVAAWVNAMSPEPLGDAAPQPDSSGAAIGDSVVRQAMTSLSRSVNHSNNLVGSFDKDLAVATLTVLRRGGHRLDPDELYAWALANGWPARGAERLKEYATKIAGGTQMRVRAWPLRQDILQVWRVDATKSTGEPGVAP